MVNHMSGTATQDGYGAPPWTEGAGRHGPGWNGAPWSGSRGWHPPFGPRVLWIAVMVLGFIAWWPIGLAALLFLIGGRRMAYEWRGCGWHGHRGRTGDRADRWAGWRNACGRGDQAPSSGNRAFDGYRTDTLRRLEEEQREFAAFLDRLRFAKDKAEFDAFMTERREHPEPPPEPAPG